MKRSRGWSCGESSGLQNNCVDHDTLSSHVALLSLVDRVGVAADRKTASVDARKMPNTCSQLASMASLFEELWLNRICVFCLEAGELEIHDTLTRANLSALNETLRIPVHLNCKRSSYYMDILKPGFKQRASNCLKLAKVYTAIGRNALASTYVAWVRNSRMHQFSSGDSYYVCLVNLERGELQREYIAEDMSKLPFLVQVEEMCKKLKTRTRKLQAYLDSYNGIAARHFVEGFPHVVPLDLSRFKSLGDILSFTKPYASTGSRDLTPFFRRTQRKHQLQQSFATPEMPPVFEALLSEVTKRMHQYIAVYCYTNLIPDACSALRTEVDHNRSLYADLEGKRNIPTLLVTHQSNLNKIIEGLIHSVPPFLSTFEINWESLKSEERAAVTKLFYIIQAMHFRNHDLSKFIYSADCSFQSECEFCSMAVDAFKQVPKSSIVNRVNTACQVIIKKLAERSQSYCSPTWSWQPPAHFIKLALRKRKKDTSQRYAS
mmetsp:Transcript_448/g.1075  ORF Transcript_448/g.1075 Transcript_448/m.1075 type:complete len:490 (-) Transcript_448:729-2198(-)